MIYEAPQPVSETPEQPEKAKSQRNQQVSAQPATDASTLDKPMLASPMLDSPILDNPTQDNPILENPTQLNTNKLSAEYGELLAQKQRDYAAYREARDQMRELLTVKANVDRVTEQEPDQQKEQSQHR